MDIPRRLAYELSWFDNPHIGANARLKHAALLARQTELKYRIRRSDVLDRWVMRKYRQHPEPLPIRPISPLSPMLIDEVIEHGRIVDQG